MSPGIRGGMGGFLPILRLRVKRLLFRSEPVRDIPARLRGNMRSVIVVSAPDALFSEAVFILREDAAGETGISRRELLEQAEHAAERYTASLLPKRTRPVLNPVAAFLLGAAAAMLARWLLGMI